MQCKFDLHETYKCLHFLNKRKSSNKNWDIKGDIDFKKSKMTYLF